MRRGFLYQHTQVAPIADLISGFRSECGRERKNIARIRNGDQRERWGRAASIAEEPEITTSVAGDTGLPRCGA